MKLKVVGYQARVLPNCGWRFIAATKTESILERMAYLKSITSQGKPVYQVRIIYSDTE